MSSKVAEVEADLAMINGEVTENSGIEFGVELMEFAASLAGGTDDELESAREALLKAAGPAVLVDAAGVAGNFQRMVRIADALGIPVDSVDNDLSNEIRRDLDLYRFGTAENSPQAAA